MFADDFVGLTNNAEDLRKLIDVVQEFCNKWRLKSNIKKSAVMVYFLKRLLKVPIIDNTPWVRKLSGSSKRGVGLFSSVLIFHSKVRPPYMLYTYAHPPLKVLWNPPSRNWMKKVYSE